MTYKPWLIAALALCMGGCAVHAVTSGRYAVQDTRGSAAVSAVEVRFSESANAVAVNRQWLSSGEVTEREVRFGSNSSWRINRQALDVRRTAAGGEMLFSGTCDKRPPAAALR